MNFLPYENLTYKTHLSKNEILRRLNDETEPKQLIRIGSIFGGHKEYEGTINENSFEIKRIISYRNSFLPQIEGIIDERKENTLIHIKMRLSAFVMIFLSIWVAIFLLLSPILIPLFFMNVKDEFTASLASYAPFLMLIFIYIMVILGFKSESSGSKRFFKKLFEAEIQVNDKKI